MAKIQSFIKKYNFIFVILMAMLCSFGIFYSDDFFKAGYLTNYADTGFPYNFVEFLKSSLVYIWSDPAIDGAGSVQVFMSTSTLILNGFTSIFEILGFPEWVLNRIFILFPYTFLISAAVFAIKKVFNEKDFSYPAAFIAVVFFATSSPIFLVPTTFLLSIAGIFVAFSGLIDLYHNRSIGIYHVLFGCFLMIGMPRYAYYSVLILAPILIFFIFLYYRNFQIKKLITPFFTKRSIILFAVFMLASVFVWAPILKNLIEMGGDTRSVVGDYQYDSRVNYIFNFYRHGTDPYYASQLYLKNAHTFYHQYYNFKVPSKASEVLLFLIFLPLFFRKNKKYLLSLSAFLSLVLFTNFSSTDFYYKMMVSIPGFWILNNPEYHLTFTGIFFTLCLYVTIKNFSQIRGLKYPALAFVTAIIVIKNGLLFFDYLPERRNNLIMENSTNATLNHKQPYYKLPEAYYKMGDILNKITKKENPHFLLLPSLESSNQYLKYDFHLCCSMPNPIAYLAPYSRITYPNRFLDPKAKMALRKLKEQYEIKENILKLKNFGIAYILYQKDVVPSFNEDLHSYFIDNEKVLKEYQVIEDNEHFLLVKI